ncbi:MAG: 5-methyltetrahydropteroyltriglutamate--homocysteine S-methyltransferase, partial [Vibrio sp.]
YTFANMKSRAESAALTGKITGHNHPFIDHFNYLKQFAEEGVLPRLTIPAPAQFLKELEREPNRAQTRAVYPEQEELFADIVKAYQHVIQDAYAAGCRNLQLDDCTWGMLTDPKFQQTAGQLVDSCGCSDDHQVDTQAKLNEILNTHLRINNAALAGCPDDLVLTTHVCRGNFRSTWAASGGYESVAEVLFGQLNVDAFYLEFDTERAGDFSPLRHLAAGKKVVLGLVSSKVPELESAEEVIARIQEASEYVPLENLYLSTQCGFASTEEGNALTEAQQWAKIELVQTIAQRVWK